MSVLLRYDSKCTLKRSSRNILFLDPIILGDSFWEIYPVDHQVSLAILVLLFPADCRPVWLWQAFVSSQPCGFQPAVTLGAMAKQ